MIPNLQIVNTDLLLITIPAGILPILSAILLYSSTKELNARYLNYVSYGMIFQGLLPISFIPQAFLGEGSLAIVNVLVVLGALSTLIGVLMITWSLKIHQTGSVPTRFYIMLIFFGISISQVITGSQVQFVDGQWLIERGSIVKLLMFGGTGWITVEMLLVFYRGVESLDSLWSTISILYPVGIVSSLLLLAFREQLPLPLTAYQAPTAIGSAILTICLIKEKSLLITANTELSLVVLADRHSGLALMSYPSDSFADSRTSLTTAAITGISNIIKEISGREDLPPILGYADYIIGIYPSEKIMVYSISSGNHPLMQAMISNLTKEWENQLRFDKSSIENSEIEKFKQSVENELEIFLTHD